MLSGVLSNILDPLRTIFDLGLEAVQTRVELFSVELQEETRRLFNLILCVGALVAVGTIGLMLFALTILFAFWEAAPLQALGGLTGLYLAGAALLYRKINRSLKTGSRPFANTMAELERDRVSLGFDGEQETRERIVRAD